MAFEFKLPDVGEGITEGEIVRWLVEVGDTVGLDQPLLELQTDKAVVELPAPRAGVVASVHGEPGQVVPVGTTLVVIDAPGAAAERSTAPAAPAAPSPPEEAPSAPEAGVDGAGAVQAAPATRRLARELGVDLTRVAASGPRGRVLPGDVRAAASAPSGAGAPASGDRVPLVLTGLRRVMAEHMTTSVREIPHVTVVERLNASELVRVRTALKGPAEAQGARLTYLPWVAKALTLALADHPLFNARWEQGTCYQYQAVHLGIATDAPDGLLVPVIRDADKLSVLELARAMTLQTERAQARKLSTAELSGSTVTITGGGPLAGLFATPIINHPEVAILGVYRIQQEAQVVNGALVPCPMLYLSWTFDHRIADGAQASRFLNRLKDLLADPDQWLLRLR
ncbi:MAG: dihydrolipoamide acetyltransferase family protein [Thermaerobacter sp.]|nr:dihydrolipoamide acetyltransferase family protein [Thermaerobacter sp.]